jgi:protein-S-isoprenylcysteine O-methyltransferase Ste14
VTRNRFYAVVQSALFLLFAAVYLFVAGPRLWPPVGVVVAGDALCVLGLALMALALGTIRDNIQIAPEPKAGAHLVTTGVYARLRHPIYTGIVVTIVGLLVRRPALVPALVAAAVVGFLAFKTRYEESRLLARYPEYADYRRRSWGLLPWPRRGRHS